MEGDTAPNDPNDPNDPDDPDDPDADDPIWNTYTCTVCKKEVGVRESHLKFRCLREAGEHYLQLFFRCARCGSMTNIPVEDHIDYRTGQSS